MHALNAMKTKLNVRVNRKPNTPLNLLASLQTLVMKGDGDVKEVHASSQGKITISSSLIGACNQLLLLF